MSRAMRRQPLISKPPAKGPSFKPGGSQKPPKRQQSAAAQETEKRKRGAERIPIIGRGLSDIISELRKVTWPTREETTRLGIAVIAVSLAIGVALGGVDLAFNWLVDNTLLQWVG
jgi:preprotein translocase SecE subunit